MKKCALLTCKDMTSYVTDEPLLDEVLKKNGFLTNWVIWNEPCEWDQYDIAIIRTTWDYFENIDQFLSVIDLIEDSSCRLLNSASIVHWNAYKTYLRDLNEVGIPIVPTKYFENMSIRSIEDMFSHFRCERIIIKPVVSAAAVDTFVLNLSDKNFWLKALSIVKNKKVMVQPFMESIQSEGEFSLHFFNKKYSHTILKKPRKGDFRSQEEFGSHIVQVVPEDELLSLAHRVLEKVEEDLLFARVDMVRGDSQGFYLMELELIEPSLYFRYSINSPHFFVQELNSIIE